ncbi:MAG: glutaredoxin family protein [Dehalococcoidia bacterium]|nr:glutaredoxin family protein [Dehalococcoidia bacterium]
MEQYLTSRGVAYTYKDITLDTQAWQEFLELGDRVITPVTVIDGQLVVGFNRQRLEQLLGR